MDWSTEYHFDEMPLTIDGIRVGLFYGIAELALDDDGMSFYVNHIIVYSVDHGDNHLEVKKDHWLWEPLKKAIENEASDYFWREYES